MCKKQTRLFSYAVALLATLAGVTHSWAGDTRPNVLILYADDMGYGDLAIQNPASKIPTPNLDKLAEQGMRFTDGHSSSGICTPSRYALLTGRYHWRDFHGIVQAFGNSVFKAEQLTLPEMLQEEGYHTAAIGKWHLGWDWSSIRKPGKRGRGFEDFDWEKPIADGPLAHGFDHYFGDTVINFPPYAWIQDDRMLQIPDMQKDDDLWKPLKEGKWECRSGPMVKGWDPYDVLPEMTRRAVTYIEGRKDETEPFFLYFAFPSPHAPIVPAEEFEGSSQAGPYGDFVVQTDWTCGQLLQALETAGLSDNTIVIFTADNGSEHYAYPRALKYDHWSSEPFRGAKRDIYEGGHHVPFVVKWPGVIKPASVSEALISQVDLMATLGASINRSIPEGEAADSQNLLPVLKGEATSVRRNMVHNTNEKAFAVRQGDWVLIAAKSGNHNGKRAAEFETKRGYTSGGNHAVELYNLREDPSQHKNLSKEYPEKVRTLQTLLKDIQDQS
ncbi:MULTISPECIES: arylsulfatase [unclassified Lentimonas]|uniref:sulfatase family protein n=1 Tax=unclassified Lentimonas TaxID=2630993 RepID=UPI001326EC59|nr:MULTISPECIES: arylsulfatase [unclassified Lentimonas]CAA6676337.1 Choline-sulfatase (EC [Lentimonas sp. CC4]CAA6683773.1 Choline-sulfatase (EC [Lentimonas sp. CC6]CAA7077832.1 Choline-sulfatase (EC [Lentimonas sp. CC4]CAA7169762.1 Choline-sulfatase (EC [Lentimonas sp. CC21]CAA7179880.1 Choline-sulfatase (EC [Lentimonas sp. CC8]